MKLKGTEAMATKLRAIAATQLDRAAGALFIEASIEMTEAKRRTPVDMTPNAPHRGQLRATGFVHPVERTGRTLSTTLSFGGGVADDYAVHVHENPDAFHPVGQYKYLESVLDESRPNMLMRLGRRLGLG
jgi:hypothetical protein